MWYKEILNDLNDNTGVTLILSALGFGANELYKTRNAKKLAKEDLKSLNVSTKSYERENELYLLCSKFCLSNDNSEAECIVAYDEIRRYIIDNYLFLREEISKLGRDFADYIIEDVSIGMKDLQSEENILKKFKKIFRN